jgi:osmotically-inducible protein OsmY
VKVENGWLTLEGKVDWRFQKQAADDAVRNLSGVKSVINNIRIVTTVTPVASEVKKKIGSALQRNASLESRNVDVDITGNKVVLKGTLSSWHECNEAENAAWAIPGVQEVQNLITIDDTVYSEMD